MLKNVIKRDGRRRKFNPNKIYTAIKNAVIECSEKLTEDDIDHVVDAVISRISDKTTATVEEIQDVVEKVLMDGHKTLAKAFILYRDERNRVRNTKSEIVSTIREITESKLKDSNILRDNANESGATPAGAYGKIGSETNKMYNLLNNIDKKFAEMHKNGRIHIHDLNFYNLSFNCLFAPVGKLLKSGFECGTGFLRSPNSISTASQLTAVILQLQSNQQFGGIASDNIDFDLAPFVDKSFRKHLKKEIEAEAEYKQEATPEIRYEQISMNQSFEKIKRDWKISDIVLRRAYDATENETHQGMEALIGNLNSLQSRSGNQVPFSSLNFGLDTSRCGRMVSRNLIRSQMEGLGDGLTAIFPITIFKLMNGISKDSSDPNYDLYLESIKCLARRFYPNFVNVDSSFNKPYVKYEHTSVELMLTSQIEFLTQDNQDIRIDLKFAEPEDIISLKYEVTTGEYWTVEDCRIDGDYIAMKLKRLIPSTTISSMGCRTRILGNVNGEEITTGRGNIAFHTMNLPRIAIEAHIEADNENERIQLFYEKLDQLMHDTSKSLLDRFELISKKTYENYPFTMQSGLYYTSDNEQHQLTDQIGEIIKQGSLSIGYIGIYETLLLLTGKTYGKDVELTKLGVDIVSRIRKYTDKLTKETHLNWSTFATPAEAVAGRFATIDKKFYGNEPKLADVDSFQLFGKGYYTNSHMLPFDIETTLSNKIDIESKFHCLTNAGHIFYYKMNGDLSKNIQAVKKVIDAMYDGDLGYFTVTFDSDTCLHCGFHGIIDNECPKCGNKEEADIVRVRRITGYLTGSPKKSINSSWNNGKLNELKNRKNI